MHPAMPAPMMMIPCSGFYVGYSAVRAYIIKSPSSLLSLATVYVYDAKKLKLETSLFEDELRLSVSINDQRIDLLQQSLRLLHVN